ncbi:MAG: hypothetical protein IKW49_02985 [Opitutales bacterium]|nr:hypothetical protein [Opitutales bacterium]
MSFVSLRGGAMLPPVCFPQAGFLCQNRHFAAKNGALTRIPKRKNAVAKKVATLLAKFVLFWHYFATFYTIPKRHEKARNPVFY